ncbi:MAG: endosialidase [Lachnospiraceae bacterium]|nr:endosialidase [Lachnospiraceae bacterium]
MAVVSELIRRESDKTLSFGDYTLDSKSKVNDFDFKGDMYKVKTFKEVTKLERNGLFVYESIPGTAVEHFASDESKVEFKVEGANDAQITLELEPETEYNIAIDGTDAGVMKTNLGGKLSLSVELDEGKAVAVKITKK